LQNVLVQQPRNKRARQWPILLLAFPRSTMFPAAENILPQADPAKEPTNVNALGASDTHNSVADHEAIAFRRTATSLSASIGIVCGPLKGRNFADLQAFSISPNNV